MVTHFNKFKASHIPIQFREKSNSLDNSMSQDYHHQGLCSFSSVVERPQDEQQQQHIAHQIRQEKLRVDGFNPPPPLVAIEEEQSSGLQVYGTAGMLSEMFNFPPGLTTATATELLQSQLTQCYRHPNQRPQQQQPPTTNLGSEWFSNRQGMVVGGSLQVPSESIDNSKVLNGRDSITAHYERHHNQISSINAVESASAMNLFTMNPHPRSPSPSSAHPTTTLQGVPNAIGGHFGQFICGGASNTGNHFNTPNDIGGLNVIEGQGLSLSLSSSLQHLEAAKVEDQLRMSGGEMLFFNQGASHNHHHQIHVGFGSSLGLVNVLRNSKYAKPTQELLEEFCSVGRSQLYKKNKVSRNNNTTTSSNPNSNNPSGSKNNNNNSSKDLSPLSAADRIEHQRRKVKLLSMFDEVDKRYNHYCEQMQMVVNSFDLVMGFGAAAPYTALAQKAMSRHFKCLKDAIAAQMKHSCELLGEKDATTSGLTKGETPRLKLLEKSLRQQQRAFHQMGMMDAEAWRPQRGLPERSVTILRAWLFEHFLHPYPSDADKHLLARQTGLSKSQVSNWFINARVRLWKPMVEDMYQKEAKEEEEEDDENMEKSQNQNSSNNIEQTPTPNSSTNTITTGSETETKTAATVTAATILTVASDKRSEIKAPENDPSIVAMNRLCFSENHTEHHESSSRVTHEMAHHSFPAIQHSDGMSRREAVPGVEYGTTNIMAISGNGTRMIRFGTTAAGDVSLTLGLHHAGDLPENTHFFG
ncbi:PREDICTED: BEL1-like homeodomain protein 4 [Nicotiana attenuata]|uniref:Bel1-like homeodomain protein 2 n=1 Tax=Nicotiana attenuata TaxID=49451 RepID=A0A1J6INC2_NICAT|nr:PREDICTED: BEL1-like homeodomain protein 4 [Nicotiana attenuata]XP_019229516.1 PREDICTED: BEL1-like homeodomain protein 4 [Nicotiana attenuata]OIT06358.1 bel1-like homeodomain protein 2 [Nicotiana attenuata]